MLEPVFGADGQVWVVDNLMKFTQAHAAAIDGRLWSGVGSVAAAAVQRICAGFGGRRGGGLRRVPVGRVGIHRHMDVSGRDGGSGWLGRRYRAGSSHVLGRPFPRWHCTLMAVVNDR